MSLRAGDRCARMLDESGAGWIPETRIDVAVDGVPHFVPAEQGSRERASIREADARSIATAKHSGGTSSAQTTSLAARGTSADFSQRRDRGIDAPPAGATLEARRGVRRCDDDGR